MIQILLIEDDPGDADLTEAALKKSPVKSSLTVISDGEEALAYLRQEGDYNQATHPNLILLDLNLPGLHGREVLHQIKTDERLKHIPVVILTTSDDESEVFRSYKLGANCYVSKPIGLKQFTSVVQSIREFWFTIVHLPNF
ncbi:MAG: response regulator [Coleofasciculus sp. B1-GNL1-01]|uniref:response regulator n=1 Tax=Coleofasciculus sp. B1-GNL1-01 TaxID=3068484 RepID=UPI00330539E5